MSGDHRSLHGRLAWLWTLIYLCGGVLGLRLAQLQLLEGMAYRLAAERNRSQIIYQTAPRGRIYDRKGTVLATNRPAFSLIYLPPGKGKKKSDMDALARELAKHLGQDPQGLSESLGEAVREETAVRLAENLPTETMFKLSELEAIYPGVDLIVEARRSYPFGNFASHLIGYLGKMDPRSWRQLKNKGYRVDSRIGRLGIESFFENALRGRDGGIRMEVDAQGRLKRILETIASEPGSDIYLTLDAAVQKAADDGLRRSTTGRGAVVALDPRDGSILALSSAPDFDPNAFLSSDPETVRRGTSELPEFNHAIMGLYQPGSIFKIIVGAAGLNEGRFSTRDSVFCPGYFELGRKIFKCWDKKGHKLVSWFAGFANSCDVYFYRMGLKTGGDLIEKYERFFGLGEKTRISLKGEKSGHLFGPETRALAGRSWYDGDTVNLAIGQGELLVTPIQMAVVASAVANRGTIWKPHFIDRIVHPDGTAEREQKPERLASIALKRQTWDDIQEAMRLVVSSGTGRSAEIAGVDLRGKTGTAQNPGGEDHAWFVAFAARPGEVPSIAVAVLVENGGHGASVAGPIARDVIRAAFGLGEGRPAPVEKALRPAVPLPARPPRLPVGTL